MPNYNQTGPLGQGPMTGRKMGRCTNFGANQKDVNNETANNSNKKFMNSSLEKSRGMGSGHGKGKGFGMGKQNRLRGGI